MESFLGRHNTRWCIEGQSAASREEQDVLAADLQTKEFRYDKRRGRHGDPLCN
jgi:hypothetical protein